MGQVGVTEHPYRIGVAIGLPAEGNVLDFAALDGYTGCATVSRNTRYGYGCNDDLSVSKKALFGAEKLSLVPYTYQRDIGLPDKNNVLIFEGDICKAESINVVGMIAYVPEHAAYYLLDYENSKYYELNEERCKSIEVIGNMFEHSDLLNLN